MRLSSSVSVGVLPHQDVEILALGGDRTGEQVPGDGSRITVVPMMSQDVDALRPHFVDQMERAALRLDVDLRWRCRRWVAHFTVASAPLFVVGYTFPLNDAASAAVAADKAAASEVLREAGIPSVDHEVFRFVEGDLFAYVRRAGLPLVLKPNDESGGIDVHRLLELDALNDLLPALGKYRSLAICPYLLIEREVRAVVLDGEVRILFEKIRAPGEWRHNLRLGARTGVLDERDEADHVCLAIDATRAVGITMASVDIVTVDGSLVVLEINGAVALEHYSHASPECRERAAGYYCDVVEMSADRIRRGTIA